MSVISAFSFYDNYSKFFKANSFFVPYCCCSVVFFIVNSINGTSFYDSSKHYNVPRYPHHSNDYSFKQFMFFPHTLAFANFTSIFIDDGELIFSGVRVEVTVCENADLNFPLSPQK